MEMNSNEKAQQLIELLGRENTRLLLRLIMTADHLFPLLHRHKEYIGAFSAEVTSVLNRRWLLYPELSEYVCLVEYVTDTDEETQEAKSGMVFQIESREGTLRIWYGDTELSHWFGTGEQGELLVAINGAIPTHTRLFLSFLSVVHEQIIKQITAYENGYAVMVLKPPLKN